MALESFNAYHSYLDAMEPLNDAERGRLFTACLIYSKTGEAPELRGNERFVFPGMRAQIDRDIAKYRKKCEKNRANGEKANGTDGGRTVPNGTQEGRTPPKDKDKDKDKDNTGDICAPARATPAEPDIPFVGELRDAVEDWLSYKRERREAYKPTGLKSLMTQITNAAAEYGDTAVAGVIRDSMGSGYKGIMFDRLHGKSKTATSTADRLARLVSGGAFG